ncbi:MAG: MCE family protein [Proteobacteria bacterium]|nr:MAG: MCE family protein [Pseudomonadota bacterium]
MATPTNNFKLGLFVIAGITVGFILLLGLGARALKRDTMKFETYFNESVQGLEVGSPVKYRGVTIGTIHTVDIGPDRKHVKVEMDLDAKDVRRLGLAEDNEHVHIPPELRTQIVSQGITGVKFTQIDFFDPKTSPPEALPFPVRENYIPATASLLKSLEDAIVNAVGRLPEMADKVVGIISNIDGLLAEIRKSNVSDTAVKTLEYADQVMKDVDKLVNQVHDSNVVGKAAGTIENLDRAVTKLNTGLEKISSDNGVLSSVQRATDAYADLGRNANGTNRELEKTLKEVRETVESIKTLVDALERDPDMLVKGRAKGKTP